MLCQERVKAAAQTIKRSQPSGTVCHNSFRLPWFARNRRHLSRICIGEHSNNRARQQEDAMTKVVYKVVQHDGGWAYRLGDVYSETFATHDDALTAARIVAAEQQVGGDAEEISWQDEKGVWHVEYSDGGDRPEAEVEDTAADQAGTR
jgi:Uncharacterized protein conserved in bacteria (DUF2188)